MGGTTMQRKPHLVAWDVVTKEKAQGGLGLRSMRQLNSAFLMKLGWRMQAESSTLWARILHEKYGRGRDWTYLIDRRYPCSNTWKRIMETMHLTEQGVDIAIGDDRLAKLWVHRWLDGKKLAEQATVEVPAEHLHRRVCEYLKPETGWDWAQFAPLLPSAILQHIASNELVTEEVGDKLVWLVDKSGLFTIKSRKR